MITAVTANIWKLRNSNGGAGEESLSSGEGEGEGRLDTVKPSLSITNLYPSS